VLLGSRFYLENVFDERFMVQPDNLSAKF